MQNTDTHQWDTHAVVVKGGDTGRDYRVRAESGYTYWRNRRFLRPFYRPAVTQTQSSDARDKPVANNPNHTSSTTRRPRAQDESANNGTMPRRSTRPRRPVTRLDW